jgi:hypothetical protein
VGKDKKPDLVVWNDEKGYYARSLTYGSDLGAPVIKLDNVGGWKQAQVDKINKVFTKKFDEIKEELKLLMEEVKWNELVYSATYNFVPVMGERYYLYERKDGGFFLSLIGPSEWNMKFIGTTTLDSNNKWIKVI